MEGTNVQMDTIRRKRGVYDYLHTGRAESKTERQSLEKTMSSNADAC